MCSSRCGVDCTTCERKEAVHCLGCNAMKQPFWGSPCQVKTCCEEKHLQHCGECKEFPCEMCANMGKEMGFDPEPRLANLRAWANEKTAAETLKVTLHKDGSDKLRVKTHFDHKDFVVEVQKNDDVNVYSFASKRARGGGLFS